MQLRAIADTISTYLTLVSALVLPLLLVVWARSYMVRDSYLRVNDGQAVLAGVINGEFTLWTAPTPRELSMRDHRSRDATWGWSYRRTFQRTAGADHVWFIGFAYGESDRFPWRTPIETTGKVKAICFPLWLPALLFGILPMRLISRNMQSSADFLAQRAAEKEARDLEVLAAASPSSSSSRSVSAPVSAA